MTVQAVSDGPNECISAKINEIGVMYMAYEMKPICEVDLSMKVVPYDCQIVDNMRILIKVKLNEDSNKKAVVIGINPSVACEGKSDTTLTKISKYLTQFGIGELAMINLYETISTQQDGIDFEQECHLEKHEQLLIAADMIVVAWGTENKYLKAKGYAFQYLMQWSDKVYCIQDVKGNKPRHPSRISYTDVLVKYYGEYRPWKYPVVTLCGSTRFKNEFLETQKRLTLEGYIVISVGLFGHSGDEEVWENMDEGTLTKTKEMLDDMHKRKIDMADEIFVINVGDYIGDSTRSEIAYAKAHGMKVRYLEPHNEE